VITALPSHAIASADFATASHTARERPCRPAACRGHAAAAGRENARQILQQRELAHAAGSLVPCPRSVGGNHRWSGRPANARWEGSARRRRDLGDSACASAASCCTRLERGRRWASASWRSLPTGAAGGRRRRAEGGASELSAARRSGSAMAGETLVEIAASPSAASTSRRSHSCSVAPLLVAVRPRWIAAEAATPRKAQGEQQQNWSSAGPEHDGSAGD